MHVGRIAMKKSSEDAKNVFFDAKRLLGELIDSPKIQEFRNIWPFAVTGHPDTNYDKAHFVNVYREKLTPIPPEQISSEVLKSMLKDVCRRLEITKYDIEAVITVPAYFNMAQKRATLEAAEKAGINVIRLLSAPIAAALCYQMDVGQSKKLKEGDYVFAFDLGGGTFDVTVMKVEKGVFKAIALGGDSHIGGRDFDNVIVQIIKERLKKQLGENRFNELLSQPKYRYRMMKVASDVKESLSTTESETLILSDIYSEAADEGITRKEFEERAQELINKVKECCEKVLVDAAIEPTDVDYVFCVGGGSKMPFVSRILENLFPSSRIYRDVLSADESIAKGATMYAAKLLQVTDDPIIKNILIQDALPISIGIEVAGNKFRPILKKNSPIPNSGTISLSTSESYQTVAIVPVSRFIELVKCNIYFQLYEGPSEDLDEANYIGEIEVTGIPPRPAGEVSVTVSLSLDINGILKAEARIQAGYNAITTRIEYELKFDRDNELEIVT